MTAFPIDLVKNIIQKSLVKTAGSFLIYMLLLSASATATVVMPNDVPYLSWQNGETLYIYTSSSEDDIERLSAYNEAIRSMYEKSFSWRIDEERDLILTSSRQQIANAYATIQPNVKTVWYPSGFGMLEDMAESSWLMALISHETAHLYQLNVKSSFGARLHSIFGNALLISPVPILPFFIQPNVALPRFLLEGNAVLSESRLNIGGRLHSGEIRAMALAHIKDHLITPTRLINEEFKYPFGEEAYVQGGYFEAHLAAKYGIDKTNQFFRAQAEHYINPLILNKTFRDHFGSSFPQEVREYVRGLEPMAEKQSSTPGKPLVQSLFIAPMNHDDRRIWFVSSDGVQLPVLHVYDKNTKLWTHTTKNLLSGKAFFRGDRVETAATDKHDLHHIEHSLYGEDRAFDPEFRSQIVTDQRAGKTASFDAREHWLEPRILLNGENYDIGHSSPVLDEQGHVYYFRQDGLARTLYRDREPVFKYEGFYGKITEIGSDGSVYFIANTDYGSSLYRYNGKEISRMLSSDRVLDARRIDERNFLATEVESSGNSVYLAQAAPTPSQPAQYQYAFASESLTPQSVATPEEIKSQQRDYSSLQQLRYSSLDFSSFWQSRDGLGAALLAAFNDPLQFNTLTLGYSGLTGDHTPQQAKVTYMNSKYLVNWSAQYLYESERYQVSGVDRMAFSQECSLGIRYPLLRWRNWDSEVGLNAYYKNRGGTNDPANLASPRGGREETLGSQPNFHLLWQKAPQLGFFPWRQFEFSARQRLDASANSWTKRHNIAALDSNYIHGFPNEFYASGFLSGAWADGRDIRVNNEISSQTNEIRLSLLTPYRDYLVQSGASARVEFTKVFNVWAYSPRIPIGLHRFAPFVVAQGSYLSQNVDVPPSIFEFGYGFDLHLLLAHLIPGKFRLLSAYNTRTPKDQNMQALFNVHFDF